MRVTVDAPAEPEILEALCAGLVAANVELIPIYGLPPLYQAGVIYRREPKGRERWQLAPQTFSIGHGDCEDLATWRAAELRLGGVDARVRIYRASRRTMHVIVETPNGYEDPSRVLGM